MYKNKKGLIVLTAIIASTMSYYYLNKSNELHTTKISDTVKIEKTQKNTNQKNVFSPSETAIASQQLSTAKLKISQQQKEILALKSDKTHPKDHRAKHHHARPHGHEKTTNSPENMPPGEPKLISEKK